MVEADTQLDRMGGAQCLLCEVACVVVGLEGLLSGLIFLVSSGVLRDVAIVVGFHFVEEGLAFTALRVRNQEVSEQVQDLLADSRHLLLNRFLVLLDLAYVLCVSLILLLLLN